MTILHTPKLPNTRLLSPEWNAAHTDSKPYADTFMFSLPLAVIADGFNAPMEIDAIQCSQLTGFQSCRAGSIVGGAVNIRNLAIVGGCLLPFQLVFRLMINAVPTNALITFTTGDPPKKSACVSEALINFVQDDIIWIRVENNSPPPCTLQITSAICCLQFTYI